MGINLKEQVMKQKHILFALLGLIGTSCSNQDLEERYTDNEQVEVIASISNSRVSFSEGNNVTYAYWQNGDGITLSTPTQENLNYTASVEESDPTTATFASEGAKLKDIAGETVYACYPASSIIDGAVALPSTNTWTDAQPPRCISKEKTCGYYGECNQRPQEVYT